MRRPVPFTVVLGAALALGRLTPAQEASPSPPPAPPAAAASDRQLLERLRIMEQTQRAMEQANRELLKRLETLHDQNQALSKQVQSLSKKVEESAQKHEQEKKEREKKNQEEKEKKQKEEEEKKKKQEEENNSGLAGPGGYKERPEEAARGYSAPSSVEESGARASGARALPFAQVEGNRHLGKIPLKAFFDYGRDGIGLATADQEFLLKFRGELQADYLGYLHPQNQDPVHSGFYLPRVRYYFQGHYTRPINYQLSFQRSYTTFGFLNVFVNFNYDSRFQVRFGRFKVPYTYEWYKLNNWRLITPERSLFDLNFGLSRMVGLMGWGRLFENRAEYAVGIFDGPRNSFQDYNNSKDVVAFLNLRPFEHRTDSPLKNLNLGGSVDYGNQDNPTNPTVLRTNANASSVDLGSNDPINNATVPFLQFNNGVRERGLRNLWDLHLAYYYQGLSLIGAWGTGSSSYAQRQRLPVRVPVNGFFVVASYLITGETLTERTIIDPINRFDLRPGKFGLGAFEPFARYSVLDIGNQIFTGGFADPNLWTNRVQLVDVGMNWYLNRGVKVYFDWEHALFASPVYYRPGGWAGHNDLLWVRLQLYY